MSALPLSVFGTSLRNDSLHVFPAVNEPRKLHLIEQSELCEVEPVGVPPQAHPATVTPRPSDDLRCDPGGGPYIGSFRRRTVRDRVHAQRSGRRLEVMGRGQYFVSRVPMDLSVKNRQVSF